MHEQPYAIAGDIEQLLSDRVEAPVYAIRQIAAYNLFHTGTELVGHWQGDPGVFMQSVEFDQWLSGVLRTRDSLGSTPGRLEADPVLNDRFACVAWDLPWGSAPAPNLNDAMVALPSGFEDPLCRFWAAPEIQWPVLAPQAIAQFPEDPALAVEAVALLFAPVLRADKSTVEAVDLNRLIQALLEIEGPIPLLAAYRLAAAVLNMKLELDSTLHAQLARRGSLVSAAIAFNPGASFLAATRADIQVVLTSVGAAQHARGTLSVHNDPANEGQLAITSDDLAR